MKMFKKLFLGVLLGGAVLLSACGAAAAATPAEGAETVTISHLSGVTEVPLNPTRVAVFDFGILDTMRYLGLSDYVLGTAQGTMPQFLSEFGNAPFINLGTLHEPNVELLANYNPDLIIISGRARPNFDELNSLAPTIDLGIVNGDFWGSFSDNNRAIGQIFGLESTVEAAFDRINNEIDETFARASALGGQGLIIMHNDGSLRAFGPNSRFGLIHDVLGIEAIDPNLEVVNHGYVISNEYIVAHNPDMLFVLDRNAIAGGEVATRADIENELIQLTSAYQNGHIFFLDSELWYVAQGGIGGLLRQINEISAAVEAMQ